MTREEVLRYDVWTDIYDDTRAEESPDGEWVRYKDHAKALDDTKMEIDRLREELAQQSITLSAEHQRAERILAALREQLRDTHTKVFHLEEKLTWVERERDQLTSMPAERILAALREPSEQVLLAAVEAVPYGASYAALTRCIPAAVAAAEREASA
jgi:chromosome segregation ATPase